MAGCDLTFDPAPTNLADPVPYYVLQFLRGDHPIPFDWVDLDRYDDHQQAFDKFDDLLANGDLCRVIRRWRQP